MKIQIVSDLHLEHSMNLEVKNTHGVDALLLCGDIAVAKNIERYRPFFDGVCSEFPRVLYIAGNHEYYGGGWIETRPRLLDFCRDYDNLDFLENDFTVVWNSTIVIGSTLWTSMAGATPTQVMAIERLMNDYHAIRNEKLGYRKLSIRETISTHTASMAYIREMVKRFENHRIVVMTHHLPSFRSIHPKYKMNNINHAFASELSEFIMDHPQIAVWAHGHTHSACRYTMGKTLVCSNPRGYVNDKSGAHEVPDWEPDRLVIDLNNIPVHEETVWEYD